MTHETYLPYVGTGKTDDPAPPTPPILPPRQIDPRAIERGVTVRDAIAEPGETFWRAIKIEWLDEQQSQGRHHIYVDVLDERGQRLVGAQLVVLWPSGHHKLVTEAKPGEPYSANYAMSPSRNDFSICMWFEPTDLVQGIGMGAMTPGGYNAGVHTSTVVIFQRMTMPALSVSKPVVPPLLHPIANYSLRVISQRFGENPADYARFGILGHTGVDFAVPIGTPVRAVDDGVAIEMLNDKTGYGQYIKLRHEWGESLYAHLDEYHALIPGATVKRGQMIALSGNSGNSTGPHLHFAIRIHPYNRNDGWDGFSNPLPFLAATG